MLPERILYSHIKIINDHFQDKFVTKSLCPTIEVTTKPVLNTFLGMLSKVCEGGKVSNGP